MERAQSFLNRDHQRAGTPMINSAPDALAVGQRLAAARTAGDRPLVPEFRGDIEGLRAVAVTLVVLYHVGIPGFTGGYVGVDLFFVLSGFLITGLLVREFSSSGTIRLVQFYARRARRLLPASALMLFATISLGWVLLSPLSQVTTSRTALATALYVSNVWFFRNAADYFAPATDTNPLLHTWSLAVEEQFYLLWPLLVLLGLRFGRSRRLLTMVLATVAVASFIVSIWLTRSNAPLAFFGPHARAWQFGIGGLGVLSAAALRLTAKQREAMGALGLAGILAAAVGFSDHLAYPGWPALLPSIGTVLVLLAGGGGNPTGVESILMLRPLRRLGALSYSWYLWHWPLIVGADLLFPPPSVFSRTVAALVALGCAALSMALVEHPVRHLPWLVKRPGWTLGLSALVTLSGVSLSLSSQRAALRASATPEQSRFAAAADDLSESVAEGCVPKFLEEGVRECVFGVANSVKSVILIGDSHAAQWLPALDTIAREEGWRVVVIVKSGCPMPRLTIVHTRRGAAGGPCDRWREGALLRVQELRPELVIAASFSGYVERAGVNNSEWAQLSAEDWERGSRETFARLDSARIRTVVMRDTPWPGFNVPMCLSSAAHRPWNSVDSCEFAIELALNAEVFRAEQEAIRGLTHAQLVDMSDLLCERARCPSMREGVVLYHDDNHLSGTASTSLAPALRIKLWSAMRAIDAR